MLSSEKEEQLKLYANGVFSPLSLCRNRFRMQMKHFISKFVILLMNKFKLNFGLFCCDGACFNTLFTSTWSKHFNKFYRIRNRAFMTLTSWRQQQQQQWQHHLCHNHRHHFLRFTVLVLCVHQPQQFRRIRNVCLTKHKYFNVIE